MSNNFVNIVITADNNYTDVIGVLMVSVLKNLSKDKTARFFIFSQNFSQKDLDKLDLVKKVRPCEITNIPMENYLHYFDNVDVKDFKNKWISLACYFRLLLFKILPNEIEECFYVDGDMIVNCDLSSIKLDENKIFAAVMEICAMQDRKTILSHCYELDEFEKFQEKPFQFPYFNAGFFLVNLKKARELHIFEYIMELFKKHPRLPYCDQDLLNMVFGQKYSELLQILPNKYNVFADINYDMEYDNVPCSMEDVKNAVKNPEIIHYAGGRKPWNNMDVSYFYDDWWKYYKLAPWGANWASKQYKLWLKSSKGPKFILHQIFSLKNNNNHKVLTIMGLKIKFRRSTINA